MGMLAIGTDFEYLVHDGKQVSSAIGLIGGSKDNPVWISDGNLQEDNLLAEVAINPCDTLHSFLWSIKHCTNHLSSTLSGQGYSLVPDSTHYFTREFLMYEAGHNAMVMGCDPDLDAWTGEYFTSPSPYTELRTAGAHVHFSYDNPTNLTTMRTVQLMDYVLGAWSVTVDVDKVRRNLYGKAGSFRMKSYGGEYRALSNFWVQSDELITEVYNRTKFCVDNPSVINLLLPEFSGGVVKEAINTYNTRTCQSICTLVNSLMEAA